MKRTNRILGLSALTLATAVGCATPPRPAELVDARAAYNRAQAGPAGETNRAGLMEARQALDAAEHEYRTDPRSKDVKTLGYVALRKAQTAEADGNTALAWARQQDAEKAYLQLHVAHAWTEAERAKVDAEKARRAQEVSERRAKVALDRLGLTAKEEPRGTVITIPGAAMFATNESDILPAARERLADVASAVKQVLAERAQKDEGRKILLVGYTDHVGTEEHNLELSKRRADAVKDFFAKHGIDPSMMETEGRGEEDPVGDNMTKEGRAQNRRVEIVISPARGTNK
jgi:outer membrane protein OmpA-like peptidoglycan-associated protein